MKLWRTLGVSLVVALALLLAVGGSASALVEHLTLDELTTEADSILVGEVTDIASYQEGEGNIYTLVTLSVEQAIKGEPGKEVVIKLPGGEVDGLGLWVSDTPRFRLGERTMVFLEEVENAFGVSGWYQGKFTIRDDRVVERDQSLTGFMADISRAMEAQGITPKVSIRPTSEVLERLLESEAVEPAKTEEFLTGWQNIMTDDFEEAFPGSTWTLFGDPTWDKESSKANTGTYSVWSAGSSYDPPSNYPNNMNAWMVYGLFSLVGATDAELNFYRWVETEPGQDYFKFLASIDGTSFHGWQMWGDWSTWEYQSFDLTSVPILDDLTGQPQVWIAFKFDSDSANTDKGAFVDDVVLRKYFTGGVPPQIDSISPASGPAGTGFEVTITGTDFGATQGSSGVAFWRRGSTYIGVPIVSWSDTEIVCEVPSGASSGSTSNGVRVTTSAGSSNDFPFTVTFSYSGWKWLGANPMGERFLINPNTADTTGEWRAVIDATQAWNDVDNANFYFEYGRLTSATDSSLNGYNEIMWVNYDTGSIATASIWYDGSGIYECDIRFNDLNYTWDTSGSPSGSQMDVQTIATHELGHWLLLLDLYGSADSEKTMYGFGATGETKKRTLEAEDIAGIQWIYPGTGSRGQYHLQLTNNDDDNLTVYFKADTDADYEDYRQVSVPSGHTLTSFWDVVANGSRQVSIKWTDPDKGTEDFLTSDWLDVPVEGDTEFSFTIPQYPAANNPPVLSGGAVSPNTGDTSTTFTYSVTYTDDDNDPPASPMVSIDNGPLQDMTVKAGEDGDYTNGEVYEYTTSGLSKGSHTFQFAASDGVDAATGDIGIHTGPTVTWGVPPDFEADPRSGDAPLEVTFDPTWTDGGVLPYVKAEWDFGDGTDLIVEDPLGVDTMLPVTHTYETAGTYTVSLTITDSSEPPLVHTETKIDYITVEGEVPPEPPVTWELTAAGFFAKHLPDAYTGEVVLANLDLADIPAQVQGVWWWDGSEYIFWIPGVGGELTTLQGGLVADYKVLVTGACDWTIPLP